MYKADAAVESLSLDDKLKRIDQAFSMPSWWYQIRGWLLVQLVYRSSVHAQIRFFARHISEKHLDAPVGEGTLLALALVWRKLLGRPPAHITGIDYSRVMVAGSSRRFARNANIQIEWGDVGNLKFADQTFTSVNVPNALHCFPDPEGALSELHRVLKPGGTLAANILLHPRGPRFMRWLPGKIVARSIRDGDLNRTFDLEELLKMVRDHGFRVRESTVRGNTLYLVAEKQESQGAR
jgi:ubiquinone/menaquinone biosynthesis C-methylase UbiE